MAATPKVNLETLVQALLPTIQQAVSEAVGQALASQPKAEKQAGTSKRRKARKVVDLPDFPEGFVKDASFAWKKADGSARTHRITSIKDGVAFTRSLEGFKGTWKSTTIIAALQTESVTLVDETKSPAKDKARVTRPKKARKPKAA